MSMHDVIASHLDDTPWRPCANRHGVAVAAGRPDGSATLGFRTTTTIDASIERVAAVLGPGLLAAFAVMNRHYAGGAVCAAATAETPAVVVTRFALPWPLAPREFLHTLELSAPASGRRFIGYGAPPAPERWPIESGHIRCPIAPSGQRLTALSPGRTRVEHLMVYRLAGRIPRWMQDALFRAGHVAAYLEEWARLSEAIAAQEEP